MGQPKALLPWGDATVIQKVVQTAASLSDSDIRVISGAYHKQLATKLQDQKLEVHFNPNWELGMGASLAEGVRIIDDENIDGVLILLADMPTVSIDHLLNLIKSFESQSAEVVCTQYDHIQGVPAIFGRSTFTHLKQLKGDEGAKNLLSRPEFEVTAVSSDRPFEDLDTPEQYEALRKKYRC